MTEETFDWRSFLTRWSEEWADAHADADDNRAGDEEPLRARWLGFEPASAERTAAMEAWVGQPLPPSYRAFLEVSDGWRHAGGFVWRLAGTEGARWHRDGAGVGRLDREFLDENSSPEQVMRAGMWDRALQLDVESDLVLVLLDPLDRDEAGEWAVYRHASWSGGPPTRYGSFRAFMAAMYREFHRLASGRTEGRFVNSTTRALDELVEQGRAEALRGGYERAEAALKEAAEFGRPRATEMLDQIRRLLGQTWSVGFGGLAADPRYTGDVVAVLAAEHIRSQRDQGSWEFVLRSASGEVRGAAAEILRQVAEQTFRYTAPGAFGRAVEHAREQARWGGTDEAWRTLLAGLPHWTPLGPDHLAPLGLLADPLLGPLVTPERGRELLAVPRGGYADDGPAGVVAPAGGSGSGSRCGSGCGCGGESGCDGLAWLAAEDRQGRHDGYRFVLVEGVAPDELPARFGADGDATALGAPMTRWEAQRQRFAGGVSSTYDDKAQAFVARAGAGWSVAFDTDPASFCAPRFESPAAADSHGTRAVVVWGVPAESHAAGDGLFHLSVAEDGEERYAYTVEGADIRRSGAIPPALDPDRFFARGEDAGPDHVIAEHVLPEQDDRRGDRRAERAALTAIAAEFGVALPRFALTEGRLHSFTTRSWTRPPGPGESYGELRWMAAGES
ncbi:SMI1/KNR4 family protein [Kitasatospora sp. NPDC087315]|uniref:SMI1/KNR4 family protein n=1 Tax=Kitasatospora sp. NPDC087315 TaxID=3364069 RepID=UPI0037FEA96A